MTFLAESPALNRRPPAPRVVLNRPSILYVIGSLAIGGAERQLATLACQLAARGCPVAAFVLEGGGPLTADLDRAGVMVIDGGYDSGATFPGKLARLARAELRLVVALLQRRPTILHAFLPLAGLLAVVAGKVARTPRVLVARRALATHQDRHPYWRRVDRWVARHVDVITANALAVAVDTAQRDGVLLANIRVIPNGIDTGPFDAARPMRTSNRTRLGIGANDVAFVCVANLIPYKGHLDLLAAFALVIRVHPEARLFLVGADRGIGAALAGRASELKIASAVMQLGHRDDIPAILDAMDVAVLASHEEGMSNAILEYLAAGLPIVATRVGGTPEILEGLPGCHLVAREDPDSLAGAMMKALAEFEDSATRTVRRQSAARRFSIDAMVEKHLALYTEN